MTTAPSLERLLDAIRSNGLRVETMRDSLEYMAQCPAHDDGRPSLHITYRPDRGAVVLKCFAGCDTGAILDALRLDYTDLFDTPPAGVSGRDAMRSRYRRLEADELTALSKRAEATPQTEPEPEAFTMPERSVPDDDMGAPSPQFTAICGRLGETPRPQPFTAACPVCGEAGALRVLYSPLQHATLFRCSACGGGEDYARRLASAIEADPAAVCSNGLEVMAYDDSAGVVYEYSDGLKVSRTPAKRIRQHGRTKGRHPLWLADQVAGYAGDGATVFLVEGEKDAATLWACGFPATTAPGGGGNLSTVLDPASVNKVFTDARVIAVVDRDDAGRKWREGVETLIAPVTTSITYVHAAGDAHDTTDAIMMRETFTTLPPDAKQQDMDSVALADVTDDDPDRFEAFWDRAPYLRQIRDTARQAQAAPWSSFMAVLPRVSNLLPPHVVIPPFVGASCASLNLFVALAGPSGKGKGASERVAAALIPDMRGAVIDPPGSGEGIVTMFCERVTDESGDADSRQARTVLRCANTRALLSMPEVSSLGAVMGRQGSTLAGELTKAWSGEPLGSRTKYAAGTFRAPSFGYRLNLIVGVQYGKAGILFDEADMGLPQRFLWADTQDDPRHAITYDQWSPGGVEPLIADTSRFPDSPESIQSLYRQGDRWNMIDHGSTYPLAMIRYPETARRETFEARRRNLVGEAGDDLDAHGNLVRLKVAALLPWLDPERADPMTVTEDDWDIAGEVLAYSQSVRRRCLDMERESRQARETDRARLKRTAIREAEEDQADLEAETPAKVTAFLSKQERQGHSYTGKAIRNSVGKKWRTYVVHAIENMAKASPPRIVCTQAGGTTLTSLWALPNR